MHTDFGWLAGKRQYESYFKEINFAGITGVNFWMVNLLY